MRRNYLMRMVPVVAALLREVYKGKLAEMALWDGLTRRLAEIPFDALNAREVVQ